MKHGRSTVTVLAWVTACSIQALGCGSAPASNTMPPPGNTVSCTDMTPCALTAGMAQSGDIAAVGQVDVYTLAVPARSARTLLKVALSNMTPISPVQLFFTVESSDGSSVLATRGPQTAPGQQALGGIFLVPAGATYRIIVRDASNTHADPHNGYSLVASLLTDPDPGEPDNTPAQARPLMLSSTLSQTSGVIAYSGDIDLCQFTVPAPGVLVEWTVTQPASMGTVQLQAQLLQQSTVTPNLLSAALAIAAANAPSPGAALSVDVVRFLPAGSYLIELNDLSGTAGDPNSKWTAGVQIVPDPDPNEQNGRNDTPATATPLPVGTTLQGAIGSQGDVDWYEIQLPQSDTAQLLLLTLNPQSADSQLELTWAAGTLLSTPTNGCDESCGPSSFCGDDGGTCDYLEHADHHFLHDETAAQSVRIRHLGAAQTVRVVVEDFGDLAWSNDLYSLSAAVLPEPDINEQTSYNDEFDASTPVAYADFGDGGVEFTSQGAISAWDAIDGLTTPETPADIDWYQLQLPPRALAPPCPLPDAGELDAGLCNPNPLDGGVVYLPRPDYGVALHWKNPSDGAYLLGLQGTVALDAGTACLFSLDQTIAHPEDDGGIGFGYGDQPADLCFCVPGALADQLWLRLEAAHRSEAPNPAVYSSKPYSFELDLSPDGLQIACDGGCSGPTQPSACPGD